MSHNTIDGDKNNHNNTKKK